MRFCAASDTRVFSRAQQLEWGHSRGMSQQGNGSRGMAAGEWGARGCDPAVVGHAETLARLERLEQDDSVPG
eukprot:scaffold45592_cov71-Phaeocystis_antarctica.AAC.3